jgi:hypothetical protein
MDRDMRRDDPTGPPGPTPDLRDLLSKRHRATAPAGFRPHALDPSLLTAGGAIPDSLPLSFVLVLAPGGFSIQKPPVSAEEMSAPAPSLTDALTAAGTMLHPYDRSSRTLLQSIDAGRMPSGLLDGIPLKYVDGAALCEVRDYRGRHERRRAATCARYVAVLHPTTATTAADAEELCAQLDAVAPVTGDGYWARLAGVTSTGAGTHGTKPEPESPNVKAPHPSLPGTPARAKKAGGKSGTPGGEPGTNEKSAREREADAAAKAAAQLCRRLAVEGALLAATSAPLCLDPDPAVAQARRAAAAANSSTAALASYAALCWTRRTKPRARDQDPGDDEPPLEPAAAREWRRRARWLAQPAELQPSLGPDSGLEWYPRGVIAAEPFGGREWAEPTRGGVKETPARWACYGDVEESPLADPLRGRTLWGAPEEGAMPPPARPASVARWRAEDRLDRLGRSDDDEAPRPHVKPGWTSAGTVPESTAAEAEAEARAMAQWDLREDGAAPPPPSSEPPAAVKTEAVEVAECEPERTSMEPTGKIDWTMDRLENALGFANVLNEERIGDEEDPDDYDYDDETFKDLRVDGGHLRLRPKKRVIGWRDLGNVGSRAAAALDEREQKRRRGASRVPSDVEFKKAAAAAPGSSNANPSALALVDSKPTVLLQHYDPEWARTLDHKTSRPRPLRYTGYAVRNPHETRVYNEETRGGDAGEDVTNAEADSNADLQFRIDVGPGSVTQALKDAVTASEETPVVFEMPPFASRDFAGRFVLAFHRQATREGLVHFRPPGGSAAAPAVGTGGYAPGAIDPSKAPSRSPSRPPSRPGSVPLQTQPPQGAAQQQPPQQRSLDQARAQARELLMQGGGMSKN